MEILKQRQTVTHVSRTVEFDDIKDPGSGYSFDIGDDGEPVFNSEEAKENYELCMSQKLPLTGPYYREYRWNVTEPAEGKCSCGTIVRLEDQYLGACSCPNCGQWYNVFGERLIDPEYWED